MAGLWRVLTVAAFVTHLWVGCCAHHAHACEGAVHSDRGDAATHGDCSGDRDSHLDHGQHGPHDCQASPCSFVLPNSPANDSNPCGQTLHGSYLPPLDALPSQTGYSYGQHTLCDRFPLPVRLHLANQVQLI
jgi:hypothetical protein